MENRSLDPTFWIEHYEKEHTPWDIGAPSTPLTDYIDQLDNIEQRILIPGAGFAHEAEYLWKKGFENVFVAELAEIPLKSFLSRCPKFPESQILRRDFFEIDDRFDLILEQTFFCALLPGQRERYVHKMYELLNPGGKLVGVLFNFPLTEKGPPFGGSKEHYNDLFHAHFDIITLEPCYNSIPPRAGNEFFIHLRKKVLEVS